jgi:two-component system sensor histidine kinase SenX3
MRWDRRAPMFAIAGALLGLIALLATLQYRWLGQISGAERERMTSTLNARAAAFGQDVDREVTRAYLLFQLDPMQADRGAAAGLLARYDRWQATARFPRMIKELYLVAPAEAPGAASPIQHLNLSTRFLEPAEWPSSLDDIRQALSREPVRGAGPTAGATFMFRASVPIVWPAIPAIVVPSPMWMVSHTELRPASTSRGDARGGDLQQRQAPPEPGRGTMMSVASEPRTTIVVFDAAYIDGEMLPALAQQHFHGTGEGFDYQLAVVGPSRRTPLYQSVSDFAPAADTPADAKVDLFQVRVKDFEPLVAEVSRFTTFTALAAPGGTQRSHTIIRGAMTAVPDDNMTIGAAPMSIVVQSNNPAAVQQRLDNLLGGAASQARLTLASSPPPWRLLVKHPSGSLEQAVNAARRRNLIVSSSILGILGISVGFLVVSTRRAQDLARQQLEFVATVSHELRTPLAVIRSAADNLADGVVADEARIRQYGALVRREGLRLTDLVEQILEFAGLQSGQRRMTPQPVEIAGMLRDVAATAELPAHDTGVAIELSLADDLPPVAGDEPALRRVFQNLIGNAIKYGAAGGWIGISASSSGGSVDVRVSDRGIGIAAADQQKVFDPFYRAPGVVAAQIQGAGLGLSLVKRIVEAHGGRISLTSAPGEGSTFAVSLPVAKGDPADGRDKITQAAPQHS